MPNGAIRMRLRQDVRCCGAANCPQRVYRLNLRPVRGRRLSEAGRHWAPIARQRATRKERHSGRTWPTYCNEPNWAPPVIGGLVRAVARGDSRCKAENVFLIGRFPLMARNGHWRRMRCRPCVSARPNPAKAFAGPKRPVARKGIKTMRLRTRSQTCPLVRGRQVCSVYSCRRLGQTRPTAICTEDFPVDWEGRDEGEAV